MSRLSTPASREGGKRWYCGPFAFAAITGAGFEEARRKINEARNLPANRGITGVGNRTMIKALRGEGLSIVTDYRRTNSDTKHTLNSWLKSMSRHDRGVYLVEVTGHWITVEGRSLVIDNHTKHPVSAFTAPWQRKQVHVAYQIMGLTR